MSTAHILIVEDDDLVSRTVERSLSSNDFQISLADNGLDGIKAARKISPDLVILDVIMPEIDGYEVCRRMRSDSQLADIPILFLTAKIKDEDKVNGFLAGADDYLTKPFNIDELALRVKAILRRTNSQELERDQETNNGDNHFTPRARQILDDLQKQKKNPVANSTLVVGDYVLDTQTYELYTPSQGKVRLTPIQYDLVFHMMNYPGQLFSPSRLLDEVWDYPLDTGSPDLVRVHIKNLRDRIEKDPTSPEFIRTVPGYGYTVDYVPTAN